MSDVTTMPAPVPAPAGGDNTVKVVIYYMTSPGLAPAGQIVPGHAWNSGTVRVKRNGPHGILRQVDRRFHGDAGLLSALKDARDEAGLTLHDKGLAGVDTAAELAVAYADDPAATDEDLRGLLREVASLINKRLG